MCVEKSIVKWYCGKKKERESLWVEALSFFNYGVMGVTW